MNLQIENIQCHRNGICGAPFHVMIFRDPDEGRMLAVVFEQPYHVAVFNLDKLAIGNIAFGVNSWRGDRYESHLRKAIALANDHSVNQERAIRCQEAIDRYSDDDTYTTLVDFLADAMHFWDQNGHSFQDALDTARMHFDAEIDGDNILDNFINHATDERNKP